MSDPNGQNNTFVHWDPFLSLKKCFVTICRSSYWLCVPKHPTQLKQHEFQMLDTWDLCKQEAQKWDALRNWGKSMPENAASPLWKANIWLTECRQRQYSLSTSARLQSWVSKGWASNSLSLLPLEMQSLAEQPWPCCTLTEEPWDTVGKTY